MHAVLDEALAAFGLDVVLRDIVLPTLRQVGLDWQEGTIDVSQEHFASNVVRRFCSPSRDSGVAAAGRSHSSPALRSGEAHRPRPDRIRPRPPLARLAHPVPRSRHAGRDARQAAETTPACARRRHERRSRAARARDAGARPARRPRSARPGRSGRHGCAVRADRRAAARRRPRRGRRRGRVRLPPREQVVRDEPLAPAAVPQSSAQARKKTRQFRPTRARPARRRPRGRARPQDGGVEAVEPRLGRAGVVQPRHAPVSLEHEVPLRSSGGGRRGHRPGGEERPRHPAAVVRVREARVAEDVARRGGRRARATTRSGRAAPRSCACARTSRPRRCGRSGGRARGRSRRR